MAFFLFDSVHRHLTNFSTNAQLLIQFCTFVPANLSKARNFTTPKRGSDGVCYLPDASLISVRFLSNSLITIIIVSTAST